LAEEANTLAGSVSFYPYMDWPEGGLGCDFPKFSKMAPPIPLINDLKTILQKVYG